MKCAFIPSFIHSANPYWRLAGWALPRLSDAAGDGLRPQGADSPEDMNGEVKARVSGVDVYKGT